MKKFLAVFLLCAISCGIPDKQYDCAEDYDGWIVVGGFLGDLTIQKECEFKTIELAPLYWYDYEKGDTIGRINRRLEREKESKEIQMIIDSLEIKINSVNEN